METLSGQAGEMIVKVWVPVIERALAYYRVRESDRDDVAQAIVCTVLDKRYDEIYDPLKATLSTFIFAMVGKRIRGLKTRKGRDALKHASLVGEDEWIIEDGGLVDGPCEKSERNEFWGLVEHARVQLKKLPKRRSHVTEAGVVEERTIAVVFEQLVDGKKQVEIARKMGYSEGSISIMVGEIRKHPAVQQLLKYHNMGK